MLLLFLNLLNFLVFSMVTIVLFSVIQWSQG